MGPFQNQAFPCDFDWENDDQLLGFGAHYVSDKPIFQLLLHYYYYIIIMIYYY